MPFQKSAPAAPRRCSRGHPRLQPLLLFIAALVVYWAACEPGTPPPPIERASVPGQRLWYLAVPVAALAARDVDRLVAIPIINALSKDARVELVGSISRDGAAILFLRSAVTLSSLAVVRDALTRVQLPDGSGLPAFGAAGPPGQALRTLETTRVDALLVRGLDVTAVLASLAAAPVWLGPRVEHGRSRFSHAIRIQAATVAQVQERWRGCAREAGDLVAGRSPPADQIMRLDAGRVAAYLLLDGPGAAASCRLLAERDAHRACRPRRTMPDGERALLGWPPLESPLERNPPGR